MSSFSHTLSEIPERGNLRMSRPSVSSQKTADRLRDGGSSSNTPTKSKADTRRSVFREEGLHDLSTSVYVPQDGEVDLASAICEAQNTKSEEDTKREEGKESERHPQRWFPKIGKGSRPLIKESGTGPPGAFSSMSRVALLVVLVSVVLPLFTYSGGEDKVATVGADAGVIRIAELVDNGSSIEGRQSSPTDICTRWAQQGKFYPSGKL